MMKAPGFTILAAMALLVLSGCAALAFKGADVGSQRMAREESAEQEANEGAAEHVVEEAGKTLQKGIQPVKKAKRNAIEAARDAVD
jgi:hypothetical protein